MRIQELDRAAGRIIKGENLEEVRQFQPQLTPLQELVQEYLFFTSFGIVGTVPTEEPKTDKEREAKEKLKEVIQQLSKSNSNLQDQLVDKKIEENRDLILNHIHDMISYANRHFKTYLKPEDYRGKVSQMEKINDKYIRAVSSR